MSLVCKAALLWSLHLSFLILLQLRLDRAASSSWSVVFLPLWISDLATSLHAAYRRELLLFLGALLKMLWQVLTLTLVSTTPCILSSRMCLMLLLLILLILMILMILPLLQVLLCLYLEQGLLPSLFTVLPPLWLLLLGCLAATTKDITKTVFM